MLSIEIISEIICALVASICYYKYKHLPVRSIIYILWIAVVAELAAKYYYTYFLLSNHWIYNCYSFTFYTLFFYMVIQHIKNKKRKNYITFLSGLLLLSYVINVLVGSGGYRFMTLLHNGGMVLMVIVLLMYAVDLLKSNQALVPKNQLELFIFGGYLFFGISFIPLSFFVFGNEYLKISRATYVIFSNIQGFILVMINTLFIFAFIWTRPHKTP